MGALDEFIGAVLADDGDTREVVVDDHATYFGTELTDDSLVPGPGAELGSTVRGLGQGVCMRPELGYYEAELSSLRDAATTLNEAQQGPD